MSDLATALETEVMAARKSGDIPALLAVARAGFRRPARLYAAQAEIPPLPPQQ
ncbi:hypothetical protein AiwAL_07330 [Acidiphilium sp. AL]|uniref:Uncharacterized protein n=1 Tax=Acidiphilium iwatense TaxID=768198 RepID=A0ABS9DU92_9PROT|nr:MULTISPECIES: hypothetical protein [Acidiphilium]MCF3946298.1 hypothetical protein [Acidiphilium iwatense]MCU4159917.1 hypothetical protein [Acidiphilium sp. AL]